MIFFAVCFFALHWYGVAMLVASRTALSRSDTMPNVDTSVPATSAFWPKVDTSVPETSAFAQSCHFSTSNVSCWLRIGLAHCSITVLPNQGNMPFQAERERERQTDSVCVCVCVTFRSRTARSRADTMPNVISQNVLIKMFL